MGDSLLDIRLIYLEPAAAEFPRGKEILSRFPDAVRVKVQSDQRIPTFTATIPDMRDWVRIDREALVRHADFIASSTADGYAKARAYCYVPRHKRYSNPSPCSRTSTGSPAISGGTSRDRESGRPRTSATRNWATTRTSTGCLHRARPSLNDFHAAGTEQSAGRRLRQHSNAHPIYTVSITWPRPSGRFEQHHSCRLSMGHPPTPRMPPLRFEPRRPPTSQRWASARSCG